MLFRPSQSFAVYAGLLSLASVSLADPLRTTAADSMPTNGVTGTIPFQSGMVSNCNAFHLVKDTDLCDGIAKAYGISLDQFHTWNPAVGETCAALQPEYYVCVSMVGAEPLTLTTTTKPTMSAFAVPPPTCTFDVTKGEYICPTPTKAAATSVFIPPVCSFNVSKGQYICPTPTKAAA